MTMENRQQRNPCIELLRIVSMLGIVLAHVAAFGPWIYKTDAVTVFSWKGALWQTIDIFGQVGVTVFTLISAYFLCNRLKKSFKKNIIHTWLRVIAVTLPFFVLRLLFGAFSIETRPSFLDFLQSVFPIIYNQYWYATAYITLLIFLPFINTFCSSLTYIELKRFTSALFAVVFVWKLINPSISNFTDVLYLLVIYLIGCIIRRQVDAGQKPLSFGITFLIVLVCFLFTFLGSFFVRSDNWLTQHFNYPINLFGAGSGASPLFSVIAGSAIFSHVVKSGNSGLSDRINDTIRKIAEYMFYVYLIHLNPYFCTLCLNNIYGIAQPYGLAATVEALISRTLIVFSISFIVSIVIDKIIYTLIHKTYRLVVDRFETIHINKNM